MVTYIRQGSKNSCKKIGRKVLQNREDYDIIHQGLILLRICAMI